MLSLKPPWKQKNPAMEKACQAYHKNTAPAKAVEVFNNLKVTKNGNPLAKEILYSSKAWKETKQTTAAFKLGTGYPALLVVINTRDGDVGRIRIGKFLGGEMVVHYRGRVIKRLSRPEQYAVIKKL